MSVWVCECECECECMSVSKVCESMSISMTVWKCVIMSVEVEGVCVSVRSPSFWNS